MKHIVKRAGHTEAFNPEKVYASVYAACLALRVTQPEAELIAKNVSLAVKKWIENKARVTSHEIGQEVAKILGYYHPDASFLYHHHHDVR